MGLNEAMISANVPASEVPLHGNHNGSEERGGYRADGVDEAVGPGRNFGFRAVESESRYT